ncbi:MAG TPA: 2-oxoglutarate dehydrogenase complex dihydrolipoyllysine-residue succinyltransferase [Alphaproteobacteria bacterium]|nr:2-oxoglutarate dehydrogenase complex dihydrolipoyllysine-residue succinyltransferase [Alphaproteobacteria bacterium]
MAVDIVVPTLGESVTEATVAKWHKAAGDRVEIDEPLVELETDKVAVEVNAQVAGVIDEILVQTGGEVAVGAVLGRIAEGAAGAKAAPKAAAAPAAAAPAPAAAAPAATADAPLAPAVRKLIEENNLDAAKIKASGKDGRLTKEDVLAHLEKAAAAPEKPVAPKAAPAPSVPSAPSASGPREERVKMTRLRRRIAERLKEAQNTAAMLTTFNEVDMTNVMALRNAYKDNFEKRHGIKLGFMSFFVKAAIAALKEIPEVNAEIQGDELVYKNHYDVGVAVGTENGLVVPVLRDADTMGLADVEKAISAYGRKARDGKLTIEDMTGGTFTISNGGIYGSLLSTPILNTPQSGILGMHKIQERPIVIGGKIEVRPMMYLALSYDHRIVDGREAVTFLVRIKECIEDPSRLLLDV